MAYLICATVLALAAGSYAAFRRASGVMWDVEEQLVPAAAGYRSAPLREVRAKGPPPRTRYALFCAPILGVATLMLFAPVGLFLLAIPPMGFVAISGFIAGPLLVRCANAAARREPIEPLGDPVEGGLTHALAPLTREHAGDEGSN
ncbi:MAG: hypothetical protein AAF645_14495 [Myxococcota bacterium]